MEQSREDASSPSGRSDGVMDASDASADAVSRSSETDGPSQQRRADETPARADETSLPRADVTPARTREPSHLRADSIAARAEATSLPRTDEIATRVEETSLPRADGIAARADETSLPRADGSADPAEAPPLRPVRVLVSLGLAVAFGLTLVAILGYFFREPLLELAGLFVANLGGPGVAIGFFLPDAFTVPIPNDAFSALGLAGGLSFVEVSVWATLGSVLGGSTGFLIGRRLARAQWYRRVMQRRGAEVQHLIDRYGGVGLAIAAVTPLPYSLASWAAGTSPLTYGRFLAISLPLRAFRVVSVLWLLRAGLWVLEG